MPVSYSRPRYTLKGHRNLLAWGWLIACLFFALGPGASGESIKCPEGAVLSGHPPPKGKVVACQIRDAQGRWVLHGNWTSWTDEGQKFTEGKYRYGKMHGRWTFWNYEGLKITETEFEDELLVWVPRPSCPPNTKASTTPIWPGGENPPVASVWFLVTCVKDAETDRVVRHGSYTEWYPNKQKRGEGQYIDGEEDGSVKVWEPDGKIAMMGTYRHGVQVGHWTWWHENGNKRLEGSYKDGKQHGQWRTFYENGNVKDEKRYNNGIKDGLWTRYRENGTKAEDFQYKDDKRNGKSRAFHDNGVVRMIDEYRDGKFVRRLYKTTRSGRVLAVTESTCIEQGGRWGTFGLLVIPECDLATDDAGKACQDWRDCESVCISDIREEGKKTMGKCFDKTITRGTCMNYVEYGVTTGVICVD